MADLRGCEVSSVRFPGTASNRDLCGWGLRVSMPLMAAAQALTIRRINLSHAPSQGDLLPFSLLEGCFGRVAIQDRYPVLLMTFGAGDAGGLHASSILSLPLTPNVQQEC